MMGTFGTAIANSQESSMAGIKLNLQLDVVSDQAHEEVAHAVGNLVQRNRSRQGFVRAGYA